ncbi:LysR family transcriptional regulator [Oceanivirga miroungae]|uniref:HTH lysR-type domain-containing protein n=1 Tax=Oceanivirga miroungae TaxID=1130046 RepID=A0A6I8M6F5_9FUSO|nr:LysR family transcriptional regulator [Oceanivirga miroungae]VWL85025.1 hypothetical protein OMES3154_00302 [Oceanivirga miroungae]
MDLNALKVYYEVCKTRSFTKASENLFISQSAVSIQIKKLETSLDIKLIERDSKNFKLTLAGKKVYKITKDIFKKVTRVENEVKRIVDDKESKLIIGASHIIGEPLLPRILKDYIGKNKGVSFDIYVKNTNSLINKLKDAEIDLVLTEEEILEDADLKVIYTEEYPFIVAAPNFVKKYDDLKDIFLLRRDNIRASYYIDKFENLVGFKNKNEMIVNGSIETIKNMVSMGLGYAVLPYYSAYDKLEKKEFKILHKFKETDSKFQIIYLKDNFDNALLNDFILYLKEEDITKPLRGE